MDSNQPFPELENLPLTAPVAISTSHVNPSSENPPWTAIDLVLAACVFLGTLLVSSTVFLIIATHTMHSSPTELQKNPPAVILFSAMILGYAAMLGTMYARVSVEGLRFWDAVRWHWPRGPWYTYLLVGGIMAVGLPLLSKILPFPKSVPMDRLLQDEHSIYFLVVMGVVIAPFAEELTFRGFLYPLLDRWLEAALTVREQLSSGSKWLFLMASWGYILHRVATLGGLTEQLQSAISLLMVAFGFVAVGVVVLVRWLVGKQVQTIAICGLALACWGVIARSKNLSFSIMTWVLLSVAVILAMTSLVGVLSSVTAAWLGRLLAVLGTSLAFAIVHATQLGGAWGPLLIIFIVGLVLTIVRSVTRSIAPGFLIHVGYNFTLFAVLYVGSDHFRHLERLTK